MVSPPAATEPPPAAVPVPAAVAAFCHRWQVAELALFGSVLRDDFRPADSDVDVLVTFAAAARPTLYDLVDMREELEAMFGRPVDLLTRAGVERMANADRRRQILDTARVIHAA